MLKLDKSNIRYRSTSRWDFWTYLERNNKKRKEVAARSISSKIWSTRHEISSKIRRGWCGSDYRCRCRLAGDNSGSGCQSTDGSSGATGCWSIETTAQCICNGTSSVLKCRSDSSSGRCRVADDGTETKTSDGKLTVIMLGSIQTTRCGTSGSHTKHRHLRSWRIAGQLCRYICCTALRTIGQTCNHFIRFNRLIVRANNARWQAVRLFVGQLQGKENDKEKQGICWVRK